MIPLRVFISVQNGRQHLLAYQVEEGAIQSFRIDYLSDVRLEEPAVEFDALRARLDAMQERMWGVNTKRGRHGDEHIEHVEFTIRIDEGEDYIIRRLYRERRCGTVERIDARTYRFRADVFDTMEMVPWIRTFICRIVQMNFSNRTVENQFKTDLEQMYAMYGIGGGDGG